MRVHVYRNLQKKCWSVKDPSSGKVFNHVNNLHMHNVEFRVQPAGRDRVLKEKRKNVHAYVTGEWQTNFPYHAYVTGLWETHIKCDCGWYNDGQVTYNPYKADHFYWVKDEEPVRMVASLTLTDDGKAIVNRRTTPRNMAQNESYNLLLDAVFQGKSPYQR